VARLKWPGNSPDLNPIEHIWDLMKKRIKKRHRLIRTVEELKVEDINKAIEGQRKAVRRCWKHEGDNAFHG
jgi:transposase